MSPNKRKHGGALVAQGTYGCVYSPAFPCAGAQSDPNSVGKLFVSNESWQEENQHTERLKAMDKGQNYFIYPTGNCKIPSSQTITESPNEVAKCRLRLGDQPTVYQTIMPNAGVILSEFLVINKPAQGWVLVDLIHLLMPVFKGIEKLIEWGEVHQDLKLDNIIANRLGQVRIIDFGLMASGQRFYHENWLYHTDKTHKREFFVYPPEYRMYRGDSRLHDMTINELNDKTFAIANQQLAFGSPMHQTSLARLQSERRNKYPGDIKGAHGLSVSKAFQDAAASKKWIKKADIFSLGLILVACAKLVRNIDQNNQNFIDLVDGMIMPHPDDRLGMPEILERLKNISNTKTSIQNEYSVDSNLLRAHEIILIPKTPTYSPMDWKATTPISPDYMEED